MRRAASTRAALRALQAGLPVPQASAGGSRQNTPAERQKMLDDARATRAARRAAQQKAAAQRAADEAQLEAFAAAFGITVEDLRE